MRIYYTLLLILSALLSLVAVPTIAYIMIPQDGGNLTYLSLMISYPISLSLIAWALKKSGKIRLKDIYGKIDYNLIAIIFIATIILSSVFSFAEGNIFFSERDGLEVLASAIISFAFIPLQCFTEEFIFRILFQKAMLKDSFKSSIPSKAIALVLSSAIFASLHLFNSEALLFNSTFSSFAYYFLSGAFLFVLTYIEKGYNAAFSYHTANNLFISVFLSRDGANTIPSSSIFVTKSNFNANFAFLSLVSAIVITCAIVLAYTKARREQIDEKEQKEEENF